MPKLSRKLLMAIILVSLAVGPHYLSGAYTVSNDSGTGQTLYNNTIIGVGSNDSRTGSGNGGISTNDPSYNGLPGANGSRNTSGGVGSDGSTTGSTGSGNTSGGVGSNGTGSGTGTRENTSGGVGSNGSTMVAYGNDDGGVSTTDSSYKGLPGLTGRPNTSGGVGSDGSTTGNGNTSGGVSTSDSSYKGLPGLTGRPNTSGGVGSNGSTTGNGNTSGGVSTTDDGYKGLPGQGKTQNTNTSDGVSTNDDKYNGLPNHKNVESKCKGHYYPSDIDGHWSEIYIRRLYDLCIIEGYADGSFRPEQSVTRAELVKMALYSKGIKPNPGCYDADCGSPFMDLASWQGKWIRPAWDRKIINGYSNDRFAPNKSISRSEAVKVILATYGYGPLSTSKSFFNDVNGWSVGWVEKAHEIGLVQGVGNGNFAPDRAVTRAEAGKIIAKIMEYWDTAIK